MQWRERPHAVECKGELGVHGLFDPQRPVVVEGCDALRRRHEIGRTLSRHGSDATQDCLRRRALVARQWWVSLSQRVLRDEKGKPGQDRKHCDGREQGSAANTRRRNDRHLGFSYLPVGASGHWLSRNNLPQSVNDGGLGEETYERATCTQVARHEDQSSLGVPTWPLPPWPPRFSLSQRRG